MVPKGLTPTCHKMLMRVGHFVSDGKSSSDPTKDPAVKGVQNISDAFAKSQKHKQHSGFLTDEELKYWTENFCCTENTKPKTIKTVQNRWFKSRRHLERDMDTAAADSEMYYDLSEYSLWHDTRPKRRFVSASVSSNTLELVMHFMRQNEGGNEDAADDVPEDVGPFEEEVVPEPPTSGLADVLSADHHEVDLHARAVPEFADFQVSDADVASFDASGFWKKLERWRNDPRQGRKSPPVHSEVETPEETEFVEALLHSPTLESFPFEDAFNERSEAAAVVVDEKKTPPPSKRTGMENSFAFSDSFDSIPFTAFRSESGFKGRKDASPLSVPPRVV